MVLLETDETFCSSETQVARFREAMDHPATWKNSAACSRLAVRLGLVVSPTNSKSVYMRCVPSNKTTKKRFWIDVLAKLEGDVPPSESATGMSRSPIFPASHVVASGA